MQDVVLSNGFGSDTKLFLFLMVLHALCALSLVGYKGLFQIHFLVLFLCQSKKIFKEFNL